MSPSPIHIYIYIYPYIVKTYFLKFYQQKSILIRLDLILKFN